MLGIEPRTIALQVRAVRLDYYNFPAIARENVPESYSRERRRLAGKVLRLALESPAGRQRSQVLTRRCRYQGSAPASVAVVGALARHNKASAPPYGLDSCRGTRSDRRGRRSAPARARVLPPSN